MHLELIENPLIVPTGDAQTTTLALHDHQRNSYAVRGSSVNDQTKSTEEQIRLLLSWITQPLNHLVARMRASNVLARDHGTQLASFSPMEGGAA